MTSDQGNFYYHVNYRTYPQDTPVTTFQAEQIPALSAELQAVIARLDAPSEAPAKAGADAKPFDVQLPAGQAATLATLAGPRAVSRFTVRWKPSEDRDEPALRCVLLEMTADGERTILAPLGDFFGTAPGLNAYQSLPLSVTKDGLLESRWVMPFQTAAEIRVRNCGPVGRGPAGRSRLRAVHLDRRHDAVPRQVAGGVRRAHRAEDRLELPDGHRQGRVRRRVVLHRQPGEGLVGRRRREDLRRRREVPQPLRHGHRGLLRLRLVLPGSVHARLPQPVRAATGRATTAGPASTASTSWTASRSPGTSASTWNCGTGRSAR